MKIILAFICILGISAISHDVFAVIAHTNVVTIWKVFKVDDNIIIHRTDVFFMLCDCV